MKACLYIRFLSPFTIFLPVQVVSPVCRGIVNYDLTLLPSGFFHPVPLPSHPLSYSAPPPPGWWEIQFSSIQVGSVVSPTAIIVSIYPKETKESLHLHDVERLY